MSLIQAAMLGLVQGLGEFLPISSSGHLLLGRILMGFNDNTAAYKMLDILLHVGTLLPVLIVFWKDWWAILKNPFRSKTLLLLFIASLPALAVKVVFDDFLDAADTGWLLGVSFLLTGFLLLLAEYVSDRNRAQKEHPGFLNAIIMGVMQSLALLPGVSRSGSTLAGGLFSGLNRRSAAKFSFMMSAPAIVGSLLVEGYGAYKDGLFEALELLPTVVGIVVAAISGYLAIRFMLRLISSVSLNWFALYVALLGVLILVMQLLALPNAPAFEYPDMAASMTRLLI